MTQLNVVGDMHPSNPGWKYLLSLLLDMACEMLAGTSPITDPVWQFLIERDGICRFETSQVRTSHVFGPPDPARVSEPSPRHAVRRSRACNCAELFTQAHFSTGRRWQNATTH